jgi:hypothetical protein
LIISNLDSFSGKIFKVTVGQDKAIIHADGKILCTSSEFFKNAVKRELVSAEADSDTIDLSEFDIDNVNLYTQWLYTKTLSAEDYEDEDNYSYLSLSKAYVLGEALSDITYKNAVLACINGVVKKFEDEGYPNAECVNTIYEGTYPGSPARRFMRDVYAKCTVASDSGSLRQYYHLRQEALRDILEELFRYRGHLEEEMLECDIEDYMESTST